MRFSRQAGLKFSLAGALLLLAGCVIAPVPLIHTEHRVAWWRDDPKAGRLTIEAQIQNWYLPIVASAEGPGKWQTGGYEIRYFLVSGKNQEGERKEIDFLKLQGDDYLGWTIHDLPGTSFLVAEKIGGWEPQEQASSRPDLARLDMIVFEGTKLKYRRTLASLDWLGTGSGSAFWRRFKKEANNRYVIYLTADGFRRYDRWTDRDELLPAGADSR